MGAVHVAMYVVHFALRVVMLCAQISTHGKAFEACQQEGMSANATGVSGLTGVLRAAGVYGLPEGSNLSGFE